MSAKIKKVIDFVKWSKVMRKTNIKAMFIIFFVWGTDVVSKYFIEKNFSDGSTLRIFGDYLQFRLVYNTGGVFGIFQNNAMIFHILSGIAILFLLIYYLRSTYEDVFFNIAIYFVLGGALGNFTDRFFRKGVVDFIDMGFGINRWPTYNVADAFISIGAIALLISFYLSEKNNVKKVT
ncbi:MAG: signal peptidase II [Spirochaetia bacterium]|nr:signal peptidase II [Spirochaetia bacterium]